jgi:hypothetical protein
MTSSDRNEHADNSVNNADHDEDITQGALFEIGSEGNTAHGNDVTDTPSTRGAQTPSAAVEAQQVYESAGMSATGAESAKEPLLSKKALIITAITVPLLAIAMAFVAFFVINPQIENKRANDTLIELWNNAGNVTLLNTEQTTFTGQSLPSANVEQKALTGSGVNASSGVFAFNNGKDVENRKTLDVYLDFGSQASRDFFAYNQSMLTSMIRSGQVEVRIHPVPTGSPLSMYAPETLAEVASVQPNKVWDLVLETMKIGPTLQDGTPQETAEAITTMLGNEMITDIEPGDVSDGTFSSWILAVGDDENLSTGYYPPVVYLNGAEVSGEDVNLNDSDALQRYILNRG